jgi:hypothetical protein
VRPAVGMQNHERCGPGPPAISGLPEVARVSQAVRFAKQSVTR